jgi:hypothetical protein
MRYADFYYTFQDTVLTLAKTNIIRISTNFIFIIPKNF